MSEYSDIIRKTFSMGDAERDKNNKIPDDLIRYTDIQYDTKDSKWNLLDVYRPKDIDGKLPVILSVHGGGWVYGDKDVYQWYCMDLARRGFAVVNYSYRLAPEYKWPASLEDTCKVSEWIIHNKDEYGFDVDHVFGVGDSAGAHLLSLYSAFLTNPDVNAPCNLPKDFTFQAIALNCGVYLMKPDVLGDTTKLMQDLLLNKGTKDEYYNISTINFITEAFPPCFVMTCPGDFLNKAPDDFIPVLKDKSVAFIYRMYGNHKNPLKHVFQCDLSLDEAKLCNDEECNFFKEFID